MKHSDFCVWFCNGNYTEQPVFISAFSEEQAKILAQAERIKKGLDYTVSHVYEASE